ncbi:MULTISPECIES: M14 family metallopeptidase [Mesonia]|uniref:Uncharacterized protein n=1 Tax=Mesonia oceanica TaxID=2687242 RepID=A0AC61Y593_9FLAO|nr:MULTISPECIES: M14 family metallopeptidase [Mesonia]MAN28263.1 peptidase [Mesonia sp.]MAQ41480.1 peptidase [Mesonia sp.]VVU99017.1 hypothetical protein FVB9532_00267 [Mesonia oceanica]|tara:strand:- start:1091 stop:2641 length:1551 start_codon:yes stop_codon:yes gene_type:complete
MKNLFLVILIAFSSICSAQMFSPQTKEVTEKFFPDVEVEINTPAFHKKKGFTTYKEMMNFLQPLVDQHPEEVQLKFIGKSQRGLEIPMLTFNKASDTSEKDKVRVWIQAGIHGDEPASTEGILYLIQQLLTNKEYQHLLDRLEIGIVPMANIDGFNDQVRDAKNGLDLNRDQTKLNASESIYLKQAFSDFKAEVALDFHEYRPFRRDFVHYREYGVTNPYDVMFLYSGNLNVPKNLREFTEDTFVANAKSLLKENNLRAYNYFSTSDCEGYTCYNLGSVNARSSATSYALANTISTLIEVRGVGLGKTSFKRRVMTTFLVAKAYLETAYNHPEEVKKEIEQAVNSRAEVVVKSKRKVSREEMSFIDLAENKLVTEEVILRNALASFPTLTRERPTAYLILPTQEKLIKRLKVLGLEVEQLSSPKTLEVESYEITDYYRDSNKYEKVHRQKVSVATHTITKTFPKGTYVVYLDQKNAGLAIETLEPEAANSFLSYDVIATQKGEELPYYRYLTPQKL